MTSDKKGGFRGSQKHLLHLLDHDSFIKKLNALLSPVPATISDEDVRSPMGKKDSTEIQIPRFCKLTGERCFLDTKLSTWWLPPGRYDKGPTWDLLSTCTVNRRRGLLLVEAKAHESELGFSGKGLKSTASLQSQRNHSHIARRLKEISSRLNARTKRVVRLTVSTRYQLANRIAWGWTLAESGIPTVLLYLGFLGDTYFAQDHFTTDEHFQRAMGAYMRGVVPLSLPETTISAPDGGSLTLIIRSLAIENASL
jgi:hypothetical protein